MVQSEDHHGSHRRLLSTPDNTDPAHGKVDAIFVPTVRDPAHLVHAAELAALLRCPLVTLHSGKWTSARSAAERLASLTDLLAIDVPDPGLLRLPDFATTRLPPSKFTRQTDTSAKRNLALMLSHRLGWQRIIFLDDDIFVDNVDDLRTAAGLLSTYNAVGLSIGGFPDNSVVCHAYRAVGGAQQSFIGGGALAVELTRNQSFFPKIYNEDWFYLLDAEKGLQQLAVTGAVRQRPYDPFRSPERARSEEFGDVLAEGVFWLLDQGRSLAEADRDHWRDFLARRDRFIDRVLTSTRTAPLDEGERKRMIAALRAAKVRLAQITPALCRGYLRALADDQRRWQRHIERRRKPMTLEAALKTLTKPGSAPLRWEIRNNSDRLPYDRRSGSSDWTRRLSNPYTTVISSPQATRRRTDAIGVAGRPGTGRS
jgi:hypothetical protein